MCGDGKRYYKYSIQISNTNSAFSSIIYLPKVFFHGNSVSVIKYVIDVLEELVFGFTSALVVSQLILLLSCCAFKE